MKQEQQAIDAQFEKKRKNAEVAQKMYGLQTYPRTVPTTYPVEYPVLTQR